MVKILEVTYSHAGLFIRAKINSEEISREKFKEITDIDTYSRSGFTWEKRVNAWAENQSEYKVEFLEVDHS